KQRLENWRPNEAQPYWMAKRAAALAEIGQVNDTDEQIRLALVESRKKSNDEHTSTGYLSVSDESYQMLLFRYVRDASDWIVDKAATAEEEKLIRDYLDNKWKQDKQRPEQDRQANSTIKPPEGFNSFDEAWNDLYGKRLNDRRVEWNQHLRTI